MLASTPQFFLEFSFLLLVFYLCIQNLNLLPTERASLLAGIPLVAFLLPGFRFAFSMDSPAMIGWAAGSFSWWEADWGVFARNASLADLILIAYWLGFAWFLARFLDQLARLGLSNNGFSVNRFFNRSFDPAQAHQRAIAALLVLGRPEDSRMLEQAQIQLPGRLHRGHFFEVALVELMVLINWWNPLIHLYRKKYLGQIRLELDRQLMPSRIVYSKEQDQIHLALRRIIASCAGFLLFINLPLPGAETYVQFFRNIEIKSQTAFLDDPTLMEPTATLEWGGHEIPLAAVHSDATLAYELYYLQPFEFYMLRQYHMRLRVGAAHPEILSLVGRIGVPHSNELSLIESNADFEERLPRLVSMGEQTLFLRLEGKDGRTWVAVLAISETAQVYNEENGMNAIARDVAGIEQIKKAKPTPVTPYRFVWGNLEIPLEKYANPDVYRGFLELPLDSFLNSVSSQMRFFARDSLLEMEHLTIRAYGDPSWRSVIWYPEIVDDAATLDEWVSRDDLAAKLTPGSEITLYGRAGDMYVNTVAIRIHDPNELYQPLFRAPEINQDPAEFDYQLINRPGYESIVRMDTLQESSHRIVNMYRNKPDYRIVHVPGFRTNERLVNAWESETEFIESQPYLSVADFNIFSELPEYHDFQDSLVQLNWGEMWAMPNSEVYEPNEYELNRRESLRLWIGSRSFTIEKATVDFARDGEVRGLYFLDSTDLQTPHVLPKAEPETSVFFKNLVIRDSAGTAYVLPVIFGFHIGKETNPGDWNILIDADTEGRSERTFEPGSYLFQHYRLSELVEELLGVRANRLTFENQKQDPWVMVRFIGEHYRESQATKIILRSLMKKYGFVVKSERLNGPVARVQVNFEDKLLESRSDTLTIAEGDKMQVFDPEGFHLLRGITLVELTHLLEDRFGQIFEMYPTPYNNIPFNFSLVLDNLPSVKKQLLDQYGLQVFEGDWSYYAVKVQFGN
ncbi:MAG: hypothetical protein KDC34_04830 [Saprospiraceae bacterium]|nr:hypothetical protein [Saprospiraceae bacterium]